MMSNKPAEKVQRKFVISLLALSDLRVLAKAANYTVCVRSLNMMKLLLKSPWHSNGKNDDRIWSIFQCSGALNYTLEELLLPDE